MGDAAGAVGYAAQAAVERPIGVVGDGVAGAVGAVGGVLGGAPRVGPPGNALLASHPDTSTHPTPPHPIPTPPL